MNTSTAPSRPASRSRRHAPPLARGVRAALTASCVLCLAACAGFPGPPPPSEADFATITPGMTSGQVLARFGPPTWSFKVRQEDLTIWNYRYDPYNCQIYQVSVRPDGTVRDAGIGQDPACDRGSGSRD